MTTPRHTLIAVTAAIDALSDRVGKGVSYLLLITMAATAIEVVARYGFGNPTSWAFEIETFTCGILYVLVGAYVQRHRAHVGVDLVYQLLSRRAQRLLRLGVNFPLGLVFAAALTYMGATTAWTSVQLLERTYTAWAPPVWPVKLMLPVGGLLLVLQLISDFLRDLFLQEGDGE